MSFGTASVDVELDAKRAVQQLQGLLQTIASSRATVSLSVNVSNIPAQVEGAIDAADSEVSVTANASDVTGSIDGAVDAADAAVEVTGDATEVTGSINGSVDAADTAVIVTGDATEVTGSIDGAVDAADSHVEVTADAPDVTGTINAAVAAADTHVTVDADDGGSLDNISDALDDVNLSLIAASGSGIRLRAIFKALSTAGVAAGLFQAAQAASDLAESTSKATVVFGQGIGEIQKFSDTSATAIGLSQQAALEATGTFGNLFTAMGSTKDAATTLAPQVVTLAADLASFNNLALDETLEKLRSGLVGEIEPLRSLGISFNAAQVEAKAMELGLVGANGEVSEGAKLQARWALILEQSTTAQGDFSRTSSGLANQQRILTAEFQNAVATLGQALLPALLQGVAVAREDLIPAFQQVGEEVLPAVAEAFVAILPLAGSFTSLLVALAPVITTVAGAIAALPPELITLLGLLATFRKLGGGGFASGLIKGFKDLSNPATGPGGFSSSLKKSVGDMVAANAASIGLSLGLAAIGLAFEEEAQKAAEFRRQVAQIRTSLDTALEPGVNTVDALAETFKDLVEQGSNGANVLAEAGITAQEFSAAVTKGGNTTEAFARALGLTTEELGILKPFFDRFSAQIDDAAKAQVEAIRASGELSEAYVDTAVAANTQQEATGEGTDAAVDYVAVLGTLTEEQNRLAEQIGVTVDETGNLVTATGPAAEAAAVLALSLEQVRTQGGNLNLELVGLATAAGNARVAEEDLQTVADGLGVSLDDLKVFVGSVNDAVNQFADDTLATLPSVGDIIGELGDDFSPQALLDKLTQATEDIADFSTNLESLAAFPRVQQIAATNGPAVAAALAQPIKDGNTQILTDLENQAGAFDLHYAGLDENLRNKLGPQIADATGLTGQLATEAFGANFHPEEEATVAVHGSITAIENANAEATTAGQDFGTASVDGYFETVGRMPGVAIAASDGSVAAINARNFAANLAGALFGRGIKEPYETQVNKLPVVTSASADKSVSAINARNGAAAIAGAIFGGGFASGTGSGAAGMSTSAAGAADSAIAKVSAKSRSASSAGFAVGSAMASGMAAGIEAAAFAVGQAAANLVSGAIEKARQKAQTGSPSRLFARLGKDMGEGVAVGLAKTSGTVVRASTDLVVAAAAAAAEHQLDFARKQMTVRPLAVAPEAQSAVRSAIAATGGTSIAFSEGAFQINFASVPDRTEAAVVGDAIGDAVVTTLNRRLVRVAARIA